jgi:hypothetical protein
MKALTAERLNKLLARQTALLAEKEHASLQSRPPQGRNADRSKPRSARRPGE